MAAAEILPVASGEASSEDVTITEPVTVCLKDAGGPEISDRAGVIILLKSDDDAYFKIGALSARTPSLIIAGAGTYRFDRIANGVACGVFRA
ncbi:MAG TPA: hypothetical protein VG757_08220 [Devosia sp.]|nr:hypothetical protein [Devosia sp.]